MNDSGQSDRLDEKQRRNRRDRLERVRRWAEYVRDEPPEDWGPQQNAVVDAQLESAREADLSADHLERIRGFGEEAPEPDTTRDASRESDDTTSPAEGT